MVENEEDLYCDERRLDLRKEVELSMVFIRESPDFAHDDLAVFPPINHENLYIDGFDRDRESSSSESSSPSSSSSSSSLSPSDSDGRFEFGRTDGKHTPSFEINVIQGWWKLLVARVVLKFQRLLTCFSRSSLCSFSRTLQSFSPVIFIVISWWMRNRARRRLHGGENEAHLRDIIKVRDERIAQLLHQIAQMNELLVKKKHSN